LHTACEIASFLVVIGLTGPLLAPWLALRISRPLRALGNPVVGRARARTAHRRAA